MESQKGVRRGLCAPFHPRTPHNEKLPIMHVMERTPLRAETGIVHDARATRACAGFRRVNGNSYPLAMSMPSSLCRENWPRSHCKTNV
jgi:hypothetical protein